MRNFNQKRLTNCSRVYRLSTIIPVCRCSYCQPNKGCNRNKDYPTSWKHNNKIKNQWQLKKVRRK